MIKVRFTATRFLFVWSRRQGNRKIIYSVTHALRETLLYPVLPPLYSVGPSGREAILRWPWSRRQSGLSSPRHLNPLQNICYHIPCAEALHFPLGGKDDAVIEHGEGDLLDIVGRNEVATSQRRYGFGQAEDGQ